MAERQAVEEIVLEQMDIHRLKKGKHCLKISHLIQKVSQNAFYTYM